MWVATRRPCFAPTPDRAPLRLPSTHSACGGWMVLELGALRTFARNNLDEMLRGIPIPVT